MNILKVERGKSFKGHQAASWFNKNTKTICTLNHYYDRSIQENYSIENDTVEIIATKYINKNSKWLMNFIEEAQALHQPDLVNTTNPVYYGRADVHLKYEDENIKLLHHMNTVYSFIRFTMSPSTPTNLSDHYDNVKMCKKLDKQCKGVMEFIKKNQTELIYTSTMDTSLIEMKGIDLMDINLYL